MAFENLDESLAKIADKLSDVGIANAPEVLEAAARVAHIEGWVALGFALAPMILCIALSIATVYAVKELNTEIAWTAGFLAFVTFALSGVVVGVSSMWIKIVDPQAYIYSQIFEKIF